MPSCLDERGVEVRIGRADHLSQGLTCCVDLVYVVINLAYVVINEQRLDCRTDRFCGIMMTPLQMACPHEGGKVGGHGLTGMCDQYSSCLGRRGGRATETP